MSLLSAWSEITYKSHVILGLHRFSPEANGFKDLLGLSLLHRHMEWERIYPNMEDEADGESSRI